jgi:hypothetical protein
MSNRMIKVINYNNIVNMNQFESTNIQITDEQKEALLACGRAFKVFADAMAIIMRENSQNISNITNAILKRIQQPEKDFTQKHKPWKKYRFYY